VEAVIAGVAQEEEGEGTTEEERERVAREKDKAVKEKEAMLKTVDVCTSPFPLLTLDETQTNRITTCFPPRADRSQRHVSTLAPEPRVLGQQH